MWINERTGKGWSDREESVIEQLMASEHCDRKEAIRAMRRRKLDDLKGGFSSPEPEASPEPASNVIEFKPRAEAVAARRGGRPAKYGTEHAREVARRAQNAAAQRTRRERSNVSKNLTATA